MGAFYVENNPCKMTRLLFSYYKLTKQIGEILTKWKKIMYRLPLEMRDFATC